MKLLIVMITLLIMYSTHINEKLKSSMVFEPYIHWMENLLERVGIRYAYLKMIIIFLGFLLAIGALDLFFNKVLFSGVSFLFSIVVLLFCFGDLHFSIQKTPIDIMRQAIHQLFSILFWFLILGPMGAIFYVLNNTLCRSLAYAGWALNIQQVLDWIPVRLLGFCFALVGHFSSVIQCWGQNVLSAPAENETFLLNCFDCACHAEVAALKDEQLATEYLIKLIYRALIVWMVVLALIIIC